MTCPPDRWNQGPLDLLYKPSAAPADAAPLPPDQGGGLQSVMWACKWLSPAPQKAAYQGMKHRPEPP